MRLLVAYDGSEGARAALREAATLAGETGAPVVVVQVVQPLIDASHVVAPSTAEALKQVTAEVQAGLDAAIAETGLSGKAEGLVVVAERGEDDAEALQRAAQEQSATMIVISSRRVSSVRGALLGSITDHVVRHAPCPVLVVRE